MKNLKNEKRFVVCIRNDDCEDLVLRKVYEVKPDRRAGKKGYLRIIDESGEDYLYPDTYFMEIKLTKKAEEVLHAVA
jgi:hypothetical protein